MCVCVLYIDIYTILLVALELEAFAAQFNLSVKVYLLFIFLYSKVLLRMTLVKLPSFILVAICHILPFPIF